METLEKKPECRPANARELRDKIDKVLDQISRPATVPLAPPSADLEATVKLSTRDFRTPPPAPVKAEPPPEPEPVPEPPPVPKPVSPARARPEPARLPPLPVPAVSQKKAGTLRGLGLIVITLAAVAMGWFWMRSTEGPAAGEPETTSPAPIVRPEQSAETPVGSVPARPPLEEQPSQVVDAPAREEPPVAMEDAIGSEPAAPPPSIRRSPAVTTPQPVPRSRETTSAFRRNVAALRRQATEHVTLGDFHLNRGEYDQAIAAYQKALKLVPIHTGARRKLNRARRAQAAEKRLGTLNQ